MNIEVSISWLNQLFFISVRTGIILIFSPIQAIRQLPITIRLVLVFTVALLIKNSLPSSIENNNFAVIGALVECANGLLIVLPLHVAFSVFLVAGQLIDNQTGLNTIAIFNPSERNQDPLSGHILGLLGSLYFLNSNGLQWLFKTLSYSFVVVPAGTYKLLFSNQTLIKCFGLMFTMAFVLASPVVLSLLIVDIACNLITRNMPQINSYFISLPIKIALGLYVLFCLVEYFNPIANKLFYHCFEIWQGWKV